MGDIAQQERRRTGRAAILIAAYVLLMAATPLLLFPGGWRTLALIILPLVWIGNRLATGHFIRRTPYDVVILLMLVMVLVSLYATYDVAVSLQKITGVLLGVSVLYGMAGFAITSQRLRLATFGLLAAMVVFMALMVVGTRWGAKVPGLQRIGDALPGLVRGLPGAAEGFHPTEVAGTLTWIVFLPLAVAVGLSLDGLYRPLRRPDRQGARQRSTHFVWAGLLLSLSVMMALVLLLTTSRSAWIGVAVGAGALLFLAGRWGKVILGLGAAVVITVILIVGPRQVVEDVFKSPPSEAGAVFTPNLEGRVEIWSRATYGIQDFPFTGMGLGTFRNVVHVLYPLFLVSPEVDIAHAHNEWLQAALDLGIPGLIAFLALQILALGMAYKAFRSDAPALVRWTAAGTLAGLVAHAVFGLTDAVALGAKPGVLFWLLLGLIAALFEQARSAASQADWYVIPQVLSAGQ